MTSIRHGSRGNRVKSFQTFLIAQGHLPEQNERGKSNADGIAGRRTEDAIRQFQKRLGFTRANGIAATKTLKRARELGWADPTREAEVDPSFCRIPPEVLRAALPKFPRGTSYDGVAKKGLRWFTYAGLSNPERKACFLANISHESSKGAWLREAGWLSPVSALAYFVKTYAKRPTIIPTSVLPRARSVLSAYRGDPKRKSKARRAFHNAEAEKIINRCYVGRAALQVTHRRNYLQLNEVLDRDFVAQPQLLERPDWALAASTVWWQKNRANRYTDGATSADAPDFRRVCNFVNRGKATTKGKPNGWTDRKAAFAKIYPILKRQC